MKKKRRATKDKNGRPLPREPYQDLPMKVFIENIPEKEFQEALEDAPDPKYQQLLLARLSPAHKNTTFASLCRTFGISLQDVHELWRHHQLHRAMIKMSNHLPGVTDTVIKAAYPKMTYCPRCDGRGFVKDESETRACPMCEGAKKIEVEGSKDAQEMVFEHAGMIGKKGGAGVTINQNFGLDAELGDLLTASQRVITEKSE